MNKADLARAVARETHRSLTPLTVSQVAFIVDLVIEQITGEVLKPSGRVEVEGLMVIAREGKKLQARVSPALKRRLQSERGV